MVRWIRQPLRDTAVRTVGRLLKTQDGKAGLAGTLSGLLDARAPLISPRETAPSAYPELGRAPDARHTPADRRPILVTARFRSGSTLLWNMFRNAGSCTAYYEPLNERRWFDPAARGRHTDRTHLHVSDYWREYNGLASLADDYQEDWIRHRLYMDERSWDPHLERYVRTLIEAAPGRPVLQFNRIDFRLAWFRHHFPDAVIVHLYRHPRDQWCSSLVNPREFPFDARMDAFAAHDHFYLLTWARDLCYYFPFIDEATVAHPYELFYYIWRLSYAFGVMHADYSLAFEHLTSDPATETRRLMAAVGIQFWDAGRVASCISRRDVGKWRSYAPDDWFKQLESKCESVLAAWAGANASGAFTLPVAG